MKKLKYTATRVFNFTSVVTTNIDYTHEVLKKGNPSWKPHQISDVKIGDVVLSYDLDKHIKKTNINVNIKISIFFIFMLLTYI